MLVIALCDEIGSGKSWTLARLCDRLNGKVDGFIAVGGERDLPNRGAVQYELQRISTGETVPYATRTDFGYSIDQHAKRTIENWAAEFQSDIFVIDEFGKWELEENGHWWLWEEMRIRKPRIVVVVVQQRVFSELEKKMGGFDLVIKVGEEEKIIEAYHQLKDWERLAVGSGVAIGIENSIGQWLHTIHFPFIGTVMPAMQAATMSRVGKQLEDKSLLIWLPFITGASRSWAPTPRRITTMVAITMQGWMFVVIHRLLGWNRLSFAISAALMGAWAMSQWFLIQYLLLGKELVKGYKSLLMLVEIETIGLPVFILAATFLNALFVSCSAIVMAGKTPTELPRSENKRERYSSKFLFWIPTAIVLALMLTSGRSMLDIALLLVQIVGVCAIFWALSVVIRQDKVRRIVARFLGWGPSFLLRKALPSR